MRRYLDPATCCGLNHMYGLYACVPTDASVKKLDELIHRMKHRLPVEPTAEEGEGYGPKHPLHKAYHDSIMLTSTITSSQIRGKGMSGEFKGKTWVEVLTSRGFYFVAQSRNYSNTVYLFVRPGSNPELSVAPFPDEIKKFAKPFPLPAFGVEEAPEKEKK